MKNCLNKINPSSWLVKIFTLINILLMFFSNKYVYILAYAIFEIMGYGVFGENKLISLILLIILLSVLLVMALIIFIKPTAKFKFYLYGFLGVCCVADIILSTINFFVSISNEKIMSTDYQFLISTIIDAIMILLMLWDTNILRKRKNV